MKKTIYLHIGMPKTGTSSIQRFLYENRLALEKKGVLYPPVLCKGEGIVVTPPEEIVNLKLLFWKTMSLFYKDVANSKKMLRECWQKEYMPFIKASSATTVILSAEELLSNNDISYLPHLFEMIKEEFDLKIIAYLRKPAEYVVSLWGEMTKVHKENPITCTLTQWIFQPMLCNWIIRPIPYDNLNYIINLLGAENVVIRPFEKCQFKNGNLIDDFLDIFNIERDNELKLLKPENESYGRSGCEFAILINKLNLTAYKRKELHSLLSSKDNDVKLIETLSDEYIEHITRQYSETLKRLANIYGKDSFFTSDYPDCYKKERPAYNNVIISLDEIRYLQEAIDRIANGQGKYSVLLHDSKVFLTIKYFVYRVLCNFVSGGTKIKCKEKRDLYKQALSL